MRLPLVPVCIRMFCMKEHAVVFESAVAFLWPYCCASVFSRVLWYILSINVQYFFPKYWTFILSHLTLIYFRYFSINIIMSCRHQDQQQNTQYIYSIPNNIGLCRDNDGWWMRHSAEITRTSGWHKDSQCKEEERTRIADRWNQINS